MMHIFVFCFHQVKIKKVEHEKKETGKSYRTQSELRHHNLYFEPSNHLVATITAISVRPLSDFCFINTFEA